MMAITWRGAKVISYRRQETSSPTPCGAMSPADPENHSPPARQDDHAVVGRARRRIDAARDRYEGSWVDAIIVEL